jgi:hypothetical protein
MSNPSLDIVITVEADEKTVKDVKNLLISDPALGENLVALLDQKLKAAGLSDTLKVTFQQNRLHLNMHHTGGLNAQEWLETGQSSNY